MSKAQLTFQYTNKQGETVTYVTDPNRPSAPVVTSTEQFDGKPVHIDDMNGGIDYPVDREQQLVFKIFCELALAFELLKVGK